MIFDYKDTSKEHLNAHIDHILDVMQEIEPNKVTILTGGNALGKSLIRKQLVFSLDKKLTDLGIEHDKRHMVASTSMQLRTESRPEWGGLSSAMHDLPWCSTADSSVHCIKELLRDDRTEKRFYVIDELEIGMSREVQVGVAQFINEKMDQLLEKSWGLLIITHSADVVKAIKHDKFINIEGLTEEEWLNRDVEPLDPEVLNKWAVELFCAVRDREKESKEKKKAEK
jgi:predicted ATPase